MEGSKSPERATAGAGALLALALVTPLAAQRPLQGNMIVSDEFPAASIQVEDGLVHLGSTEFVLYGVADVELHLFVEADGMRVKRLLWVQFEGYRDDNDHTYDYSDDPAVEVAGHTIHVNGRFYPKNGFGGRAGSDGDHALRLLQDKGYELGSDLARVRLVWLLNEPARDELMFIYLEDLADLGLSVDALRQDDVRWQELLRDLQERALDAFEIEDHPSARGREDIERR